MRMARIASLSLRSIERSLLNRKFLATCWVMVEPPSARRSLPSIFDFDDLVDGARDALEVDAAVLVEALVLSRKEGGDDALGNGVDGHEDAPLARVLGDQRAVVRVDARHDRRLVLRQALVVGKILRGLPQQVAGSARRADEHDAGGREPEAQEAQEQALAPLASARRRRVGRVDGLRRVLRRI